MHRTSLNVVCLVVLSLLLGGLWAPLVYAGDGPRLTRLIDIRSAAFDGLTATPDSSRLYVTARFDDPLHFEVLVIDTATDEIIRRIDLGEEGAPDSSARQILMSPQGDRVYTMTPLDNIIAIDVETDAIVGSVHFGQPNSKWSSRDIEIARDGSKLYVANFRDEELTVIDTTALEVTHRIPVDGYVNGLAQSHSGDRIYFLSTNSGGNGAPEPVVVSVVDTESLALIDVILAGRGHWQNHLVSGRVSSDDRILYVSAGNSEVVSVIDLRRLREVGQIEVGLSGEQIDLTSDDASLWFFRNAYITDGSIDVIDTESRQIVANIPQGGAEQGQLGRFMQKFTVFTPNDRYAIVPQYFSGSIWVTDVAKREVVDRFSTGGNPTTLYYLPDGSKAYVSARAGRGYGVATGKLAVISLTGESPCNALQRHTAKGLAGRVKSRVFTPLDSGRVTVACESDRGTFSRQTSIAPNGRANVRIKRLDEGDYICTVTEVRDDAEVLCEGLLLPVGARVE